MAYEFIRYEKRNRIAYITINRPERMNALHHLANKELRDAFTDFKDDPDSWVAIITGTGDRAFSAGNDLRYTAEHAGEAPSREVRAPFGGITSDFTCWKPIIAAVNGYALGGGLELALSCDIIIAADHAQLGLPEPRVGLVAPTGTHRLTRQIPFKVAMGYILTTRRMSAQDALRHGLVNEVVPLDKLMATAEQWANEILEVAPLSVRGTKQMAMLGADLPLDAALTRTYSEVLASRASEDVVEGPRAFSEKRPPKWTGR